MEIIPLKLTFGIVIPTLAGYSFLLALLRGHYLPLPFRIALGYGLGTGIIAAWMFILSLINVPYGLMTIAAPLVVFTAFCLFSGMKYRKDQKIKIDWGDIASGSLLVQILSAFFLTSIVVTLFYVFWRSLAIPITTYDALATAAYKSKVIYFQKTLPDLNSFPHRSYPLMIPFNQAWLGYALGYWSDIYIKIIFPLALCSFMIIQYYFLRFFTNKHWALFGVFLLFASNLLVFHATISYRDLFMMYFSCSTIILLILWHQTRISALLWTSSLFAGFATFTKLEGSAYLAIYLLVFFVINGPLSLQERSEKIKNSFIYLLPSLGICIGYHIYKFFVIFMNNTTGIVEKMDVDFSISKLALFPEIGERIVADLFYTNNWGLVWLALIFSSVHLFRKLRLTSVKILSLTLLLFFGLYITLGLLTTNYVWLFGEKSATGLSRLILHFYPLATLLIVLLNFTDKEEYPS